MSHRKEFENIAVHRTVVRLGTKRESAARIAELEAEVAMLREKASKDLESAADSILFWGAYASISILAEHNFSSMLKEAQDAANWFKNKEKS